MARRSAVEGWPPGVQEKTGVFSGAPFRRDFLASAREFALGVQKSRLQRNTAMQRETLLGSEVKVVLQANGFSRGLLHSAFMAAPEHTSRSEPNSLVEDDLLEPDYYEEEYEDDEYGDWDEDDEEFGMNHQLSRLGIHERAQTPLAIKSASSNRQKQQASVQPVPAGFKTQKSRREPSEPSTLVQGLYSGKEAQSRRDTSPNASNASTSMEQDGESSTKSWPIGTGALNVKSKIDEPFLIIPGLYLGSEAHARNENDLKRLGITHILAIHDRAKAHFPKSFDYFVIPVRDQQTVQISKHFIEAHQYIRSAREKGTGAVFVHCWAGVSRSATIVISYLMQLERLSFQEALTRTSSAKPDVEPNPGFVVQLRTFEKLLGTKGTKSSAPTRDADVSPRYGSNQANQGHSKGRKALIKRSSETGKKSNG